MNVPIHRGIPPGRLHRAAAFAAALLATGGLAAEVLADDPASGLIVLRLESAGKFEVLQSRAETTATGAVLFGLIGYGIEEGQNASEDRKREETLQPHLAEEACSGRFVEALGARLAEEGLGLAVVERDAMLPGAYDRLLIVDIDSCGYRKAGTATEELSAYFSASYQVLKPGETPSKDRESLVIRGADRKTWEALAADVPSAVAEFAAVKDKAGRRLANKLIYTRE